MGAPDFFLCLSSSSQQGSICLVKAGRIVFERSCSTPRSHVGFFNPALEEGLKQLNLKVDQLEGVALDLGPGSFTGLRVTLAVAKSLSMALEIPVFRSNSLALMTHLEQHKNFTGFHVLNAYSSQTFYSRFQNGLASGEPAVEMTSDFLKRLNSSSVVYGDVKHLESQAQLVQNASSIGERLWYPAFPTAMKLAELALESKKNDWILDWRSLQALYLRRSTAEEIAES